MDTGTVDGVVTILHAMDFAARKHVGQRRKGAQAEPYVNHCAEVGYLLGQATGGRDTTVVVAGILHDTLEDTATSRTELSDLFGIEVAELVAEVTDDKSLPKAERKRLQVLKAPHKSPGAKLIKLADKTSNLRAIVTSPPEGWDLRRQREYFQWAEAVAAGCRGLSPLLETWFDEALMRGLAHLESIDR